MSMLGVLRGPREVLFGAGQRHALGTVAAALGSRALVCTDARFGGTPEFAHLVRLLEESGVQVTTFTEVEPDVPVHQVVRCAELAASAEPDVVVGMGGGSCIGLPVRSDTKACWTEVDKSWPASSLSAAKALKPSMT